MKVTTIAKELLEEIQEHLGAGKKSAAVKAISDRLITLFEASAEEEDDVLIQIDLDCGEHKATWVNMPKLTNATIVIVENPSVGDEGEDSVYIDDDRVIVAVTQPEMMSNATDVFTAVDAFED